MADGPNVVFFHVDNLGYGELGCDGGGVLRGADTHRIDQFAQEGFRLLNYAPEAQCTPTRSALLTGRYSIRSGNHTVPFAGAGGAGLVAWERTLGDLFSEAGYATMCLGKWHVGEGEAAGQPITASTSGMRSRTPMTKPYGSSTRGIDLDVILAPRSWRAAKASKCEKRAAHLRGAARHRRRI